jgi:hypothetical protein
MLIGPNQTTGLVSVAQGKAANLTAKAVGSIPFGADVFQLTENGAGTVSAVNMTVGNIANSALGTIVSTASSIKIAFDLGVFSAAVVQCAAGQIQ